MQRKNLSTGRYYFLKFTTQLSDIFTFSTIGITLTYWLAKPSVAHMKQLPYSHMKIFSFMAGNFLWTSLTGTIEPPLEHAKAHIFEKTDTMLYNFKKAIHIKSFKMGHLCCKQWPQTYCNCLTDWFAIKVNCDSYLQTFYGCFVEELNSCALYDSKG